MGFAPADPEERPLRERCILGFNSGPPMVPSAYNNNVQIAQTPDHVVIVNEMILNCAIDVQCSTRPPFFRNRSNTSSSRRLRSSSDSHAV